MEIAMENVENIGSVGGTHNHSTIVNNNQHTVNNNQKTYKGSKVSHLQKLMLIHISMFTLFKCCPLVAMAVVGYILGSFIITNKNW